jgi:quercetin dioxygenase-like cupin family protein
VGNTGVGISAAVPTVEIDDGRVRVTKWHFEPGASTGMHTHEFDYLVVPVTGGDFSVVQPDGTVTPMAQSPGAAYARNAGVTHDVVNAGAKAASFVEIEFLTAGA